MKECWCVERESFRLTFLSPPGPAAAKLRQTILKPGVVLSGVSAIASPAQTIAPSVCIRTFKQSIPAATRLLATILAAEFLSLTWRWAWGHNRDA
jgi:hypothetical protein